MVYNKYYCYYYYCVSMAVLSGSKVVQRYVCRSRLQSFGHSRNSENLVFGSMILRVRFMRGVLRTRHVLVSQGWYRPGGVQKSVSPVRTPPVPY